eukprot:scaffold1407_cov379-Pavlova_lutheri.AAC.4
MNKSLHRFKISWYGGSRHMAIHSNIGPDVMLQQDTPYVTKDIRVTTIYSKGFICQVVLLHMAGSPLRWDPVLDNDRTKRVTPPQLDECDRGPRKAGDGKHMVPRSEGTKDVPNTSRPDRPRANPMKPRLSSGQP